MIELKNIYKSFERKSVIKDVTFCVNKGRFVSLLGPSGCGKSTILNLITGILSPDKGDILLDGQSLLGLPLDKRETLLVFQDHVLFPHMTVEKNIAFGLRMKKVNKLKRKQKVKEMLELVNLEGYEKKYPSELSGGQRQRVAIARALAVDPKVLLLDEPFSSLDRQLRVETRDFIRELQRKMEITTILVTHDQEEAWMVSDKVAIMLDGSIWQYDSPENIYLAPANKEVGIFLGNGNFIKGKVTEGVFSSSLGHHPINREDGYVEAMLRKESIHINPYRKSAYPIATVVKKSFGGQNMYYKVQCQGHLLEGIGKIGNSIKIGDKVSVEIDWNGIHYFRE